MEKKQGKVVVSLYVEQFPKIKNKLKVKKQLIQKFITNYFLGKKW